jgi:release factor glutamine methyltransferase
VLSTLYDEREAAAIVNTWLMHRLGKSKVELVFGAEDLVDSEALAEDLKRLMASEPVQYVLGTAPFLGMDLKVNRATLVPRPETEELVQEILSFYNQFPSSPASILDLGTGSGCIALALKQAFEEAEVTGVDINEKAIDTARENAALNGLAVRFELLDVLKMPLPEAELVVSNPPYIPESERSEMDPNVTEFEPTEALFVPDHDPLLFYRVIAEKAIHGFPNNQGVLAYEIHHLFGSETKELLVNLGYHDIVLLRDLQGRERMIIARYGRH